MRLSTSILTLLLSSLVGAKFFSQDPLVDTLGDSIPGDSPIKLCEGAEEDNILKIDHVNLTPNPPQAGNNLTIEASGTLSKDVEEGAYVNLQVKYGNYIKLVDTKADLCDQIQNVDLECPLKKGDNKVTKDVSLPKQIPPGKYHVFADVYTKDDEKITCLTAEVSFPRS
ncbi:MAG: Phosphatidylglycerol/phosphatidylinositol transfer protein [Piccolia ochrophora]|nr:MAG: Phosphatidylglycerol/phosphatidylinositol transfer protein [Piccolia ochrophora]